MRMFDDETPWASVRKDVRHTRATLRAAEVHGAQLAVIQKLLDRWSGLNQEVIDAEDAVTDGHAIVAWNDGVLDVHVGAFARDVEHAAGGDRAHRTFTSFFPEAPNEVIRLGLESEVARVADFDTVAKAVALPANATKSLGRVRAAAAVGTASIKAREESVKAEALCWLKVRQLKDDANKVRRSVFNALERYAIDQGLASDYADRFFLVTPKRTKKKPPATG